MIRLLSLLLLSALILPINGATVESIYLENRKEKPKDEETVFELVNNLRKRLRLTPFKVSQKLNEKAERENKLRIQRYKTSIERYPNEKHFYKRYVEDGNITSTIFMATKSSLLKYRAMTDKKYKRLAVSIIKDYNVYHSYIIFQAEKDKTAYLKEKIDFGKVLKVLDNNNIGPNQSKKRVKYKLKKILKSTKRKYRVLSSPQELTVFQSDVQTPENYLRIGFAPSDGSSAGMHNISVFFKETNYREIINWVEQTYYISPRNGNNDISNPFNFHIFDEDERLYIVVDKGKLIRLRWDNRDVSLSIEYLDYSLRYINNHKRYYSLSKNISKWMYYRLLTEFLKREPAELSSVEYIYETRVFFFDNKKEMEAYIDKFHIRIIYRYDEETGKREREDIFKNGIKIASIEL